MMGTNMKKYYFETEQANFVVCVKSGSLGNVVVAMFSKNNMTSNVYYNNVIADSLIEVDSLAFETVFIGSICIDMEKVDVESNDFVMKFGTSWENMYKNALDMLLDYNVPTGINED